MSEYGAPELVVETGWLADHLGDPGMRILEMAQDSSGFEERHIPGAIAGPDWQIKGSVNTKLVAPPAEAKAWFEAMGIGDDTLVIAYDRTRNRDAARAWWVLSYYGHTNVKVLNGGWAKWAAEGRDAEAGPSKVRGGGATFTPAPNDGMLSTVEKLTAAIGDPGHTIWDTRSVEEFTGENGRGNARKGHVPGAVHLEWTNLVNEDHTFKSADELEALFEGLGISRGSVVHTY